MVRFVSTRIVAKHMFNVEACCVCSHLFKLRLARLDTCYVACELVIYYLIPYVLPHEILEYLLRIELIVHINLNDYCKAAGRHM